MIHSKTYTEDKSYVYDNDQPEDDMKCNIFEKGISKVRNLMRHNTNVEKKINKKENTRISKPLQCEYCQKTLTIKFNLKRHNPTHM